MRAGFPLLIGLLLSVAGCVKEDSTLSMAARGIGIGNYGSLPYPRTRPEIEAFPYAQMGVRFSDFPPGILVLASLGENGVEAWVSADKISLQIEGGRVTSLSGLAPEFSARVDAGPVWEKRQAYNKTVTIRDGKASRTVELHCVLDQAGEEQTIRIVELERVVQRYEERCEGSEGTVVSDFFVSLDRPYVWRSRQVPAPGLPAIQLDVLKRPG